MRQNTNYMHTARGRCALMNVEVALNKYAANIHTHAHTHNPGPIDVSKNNTGHVCDDDTPPQAVYFFYIAGCCHPQRNLEAEN